MKQKQPFVDTHYALPIHRMRRRAAAGLSSITRRRRLNTGGRHMGYYCLPAEKARSSNLFLRES